MTFVYMALLIRSLDLCLCNSHLVAIHLVAMFEGKCFAQGDIDGITHNGHCKCITYDLGEQGGVWSNRSLEPETRGRHASGYYHWYTVHTVLTLF